LNVFICYRPELLSESRIPPTPMPLYLEFI